jgi:ribosomal protein S18 acetylase RimI-like enzyme
MIKIIRTKHNQWYDIKDGILEVEHKTFDHDSRYQEEHDDFESFVKDNTINFIVKDNDKIIGYLMSCPIENDIRYDHDEYFGKHDTFHLESMAILKKYRGTGLGNRLFEKFLETAKKLKFKRVVLDATSESMTMLALKHGFKKLTFHEKWDGDTSAWYMEKIF